MDCDNYLPTNVNLDSDTEREGFMVGVMRTFQRKAQFCAVQFTVLPLISSFFFSVSHEPTNEENFF